MKRGKRTLSKGKIYGFNPWTDQVHAIDRIMEETGEKSESTILRDLIDEGLAARRRKPAKAEIGEPSRTEGSAEPLQAIQGLLMKLVRQGQTSLRVQDVMLALVQDTLAEARATRRVSWEHLAQPAMREKGAGTTEMTKQFDRETALAKSFAYDCALEIKKSHSQN